MKIYNNIKDYFLNKEKRCNDYSNRFYIRSIKEDSSKDIEPDEIYLEPHKRDFFEIGVLLHNTVEIKIGEQTLQKRNNSLAIVSPYQTINYGKKPQKDDDEGYIIHFKATLFETLNNSYDVQNEFPFFKIHTLPLYQLADDDFTEILSIVKEIYQESRADKMHHLEIVRSLLLILLYKIKRITQNDDGIISMNRYDAIMAKFEQLIHASNNTFMAVKEYASMMNISPIYLSECVKKASGKSAQKVIIEYKIMSAKSLLHQKNRSITEVADILGFNEAANFNQFFKRNTGMTASQFRKK
ncbi:helix-turn-helix domain-containing protein [Saccharicrinis sp. 156]|uniref:helix-turn-helix domain-containing protein n=1 Tax=Saccharicrinis sp. 156 TaxID=3417574 RepID=UPI003D32E064